MAEANDKSSTIDWIWLHDALILAITRLGSVVLAKALLMEWLAAGMLPWSCMVWKPRDEEGIEELADRARDLGMPLRDIPPACREGAPEFWRSDHRILWEDNMAHQQSVVGASALGIKVPHGYLLALLPEEPRERVEELGQTEPAEQDLLEPMARSTSTAMSKKTRPQSERAERYIKKNFPGGTEGITTARIREVLGEDQDLKVELRELRRGLASAAVINRVLGRRK
ncbi:hypothetical protein ABIB94_007154 [Bradyrhizobium sp. JR7.2]|uniref:hypothetical protein n=1 Tax=unclassified Bradyrhizobium TaxID=2631580 RepID=UPI00339B0DA4